MRNLKLTCFLLLSILFTVSCAKQKIIQAQETPPSSSDNFKWPAGKKVALSLSFDDARLSNVDVGLPLFKKHDVQVTFYVNPPNMQSRMEGWKQAVKDGHEIGNHTMYHPCTGNFAWSRDKALEGYTLDKMRAELLTCNQQLEEMLGVTPTTFAYTCGQTYVGSGLDTKSYVPLIAELFTAGRGWLDENVNDPNFADFAQLLGMESDGKDFETDILPLIEQATQAGAWLLLAGHEIGEEGNQTTKVAMLEKLIAYAKDPKNGIWLAPVNTIADYINEQRKSARTEKLKKALTFYASFDEGFEADYARGAANIFTAPSYDETAQATKGMSIKQIKRIPSVGVAGGTALHFTEKTKPVLYYPSSLNMEYDKENWEGTVSLWLKLNPELDLAPGYTDPIQITDSGYDDAAIWVDFTKENPRSFRMGVYGDATVWNPDKIGPDENPAFQNRLLPAKNRSFSRTEWTHVVISFSGINTSSGIAHFYMNGQYQGQREITEPFTWEYANSKIFLGLNYVGMLDEVSIFNTSLSKEEVLELYGMKGAVRRLYQN